VVVASVTPAGVTRTVAPSVVPVLETIKLMHEYASLGEGIGRMATLEALIDLIDRHRHRRRGGRPRDWALRGGRLRRRRRRRGGRRRGWQENVQVVCGARLAEISTDPSPSVAAVDHVRSEDNPLAPSRREAELLARDETHHSIRCSAARRLLQITFSSIALPAVVTGMRLPRCGGGTIWWRRSSRLWCS